MRKLFGFLFIVGGLVLIGIGSYDGFEKYEKELTSKNNEEYYNGLYLSTGDSVMVTQEEKESMRVVINNVAYDFVYNGDYYEHEDSGFYIKFEDDELILYQDGEVIKTLYKK